MKYVSWFFKCVISLLCILLIVNYSTGYDHFESHSNITNKKVYNKIIPHTIEAEVLTALSYFPELEYIPIEFKFKNNIKRSTMQAQPKFKTLLRPRKQREYNILISSSIQIGDTSIAITEMPKPVLIGWIGHELGHVMDYESMTNTQLMAFGLDYVLSDKAVIHAERLADHYAVKNGMKDYILATKNYILNHAGISESYKNRIKKYYVSPEEIMEMVDDEG